MRAGILTVICGPMFSGKSSELMRRIRRARHARVPVALFKPELDDRSNGVSSHDGLEMHAQAVASPTEAVERQLRQWQQSGIEYAMIGFDEAQFFPGDDLLEAIQRLTTGFGASVVVAGLDLDYTGRPFGAMPTLLALADEVIKLSAVCVVCGRDAARTQRLVGGKPAGPGPQVLIGGSESYEPRCLACWVPPDRVVAPDPGPAAGGRA